MSEYVRYLENHLLAAKKLAAEALSEEERAETRPARQYWVGQHTYWSERTSYLQRRLEEEERGYE